MNLLSNLRFTQILIRRIKLVSSFIVFLLLIQPLYAQDIDKESKPRHAQIKVIARSDADSIVLRWAPTTSGGWDIANGVGYTIEKLIIRADKNTDNTGFKPVSNRPLKPLSLEKWLELSNKENVFSAVGAQAIYGKLFNPTPLSSGSMSALKNAADELSNRYSFSLFAADNDAFTADAMGLRFVDKEVELGKKYAYRIYIADSTLDYSFDTAYIIVDARKFERNLAPQNLKFKSRDGSIQLFWTEAIRNQYSGYYVYRSSDGGESFTKLNNMPMVIMMQDIENSKPTPSFIDTATNNYTNYTYKVRGVTAFAELSDAAEITAFSKDLSPPPPPIINKPKQISINEISITWQMETKPDDLNGYVVSRSQHPSNNFQLLTLEPLPISTNEYIDVLSGKDHAYYNVAAVDTAGNLTFSVSVLATRIDSTPPESPLGLQGKISPTGIVTLSWNKNTESNIKGYRILQANDPKHEFVQLTGQIYNDTVFYDSINIHTLTRGIFYRVVAVNKRFQHSEMSEILKLTRPDVVLPVKAVFSDVFVTDSSVNMQWFKSSSNDLAFQVLLKKKASSKEWITLDTLETNKESFLDLDVETGVAYEYTIVSVDSSGLLSPNATPIRAKPYDTGSRTGVRDFIAVYEPTNKTVVLNWEYNPEKKENYWFVVYKSINQDAFKEYKAVSSKNLSFTDKYAKQGTTSYGIVVMTSLGGESEMEETTVFIESAE